jgi:hypothetical protein
MGYRAGTLRWLVVAAGEAQPPLMTKRVLAAFLWFYTGWYAGAMIAEMLGVSAFLGPIIGVAAAGLVVLDPRRIIWTVRPAETPATSMEAVEAA